MLCTHRPVSSSFLGLPYRILNRNHKKELLRGLWIKLQSSSCLAEPQILVLLVASAWGRVEGVRLMIYIYIYIYKSCITHDNEYTRISIV